MREAVSAIPKAHSIKARSYQYGLDVVRLLEQLPSDYIAQTLGKQLLRSATSVGANVVEAKSSSSRRDFTNFYTHALKSANESLYWLELLRDAEKLAPELAAPLVEESTELANMLAASILTLKGRRF